MTGGVRGEGDGRGLATGFIKLFLWGTERFFYGVWRRGMSRRRDGRHFGVWMCFDIVFCIVGDVVCSVYTERRDKMCCNVFV